MDPARQKTLLANPSGIRRTCLSSIDIIDQPTARLSDRPKQRSVERRGGRRTVQLLRPKVVISSEREGLRTSNLVYRRSTKTRNTDKRYDLRGQRSRSQGHVERRGFRPTVQLRMLASHHLISSQQSIIVRQSIRLIVFSTNPL